MGFFLDFWARKICQYRGLEVLHFSPDEHIGKSAWWIKLKSLQPFLAKEWLGRYWLF